MTLQEQVCTLEQAQRLKELRCKQNAYFTWYEYLMKDGSLKYIISSDIKDAIGNNDWYSAYTVAELGEMLVKLGHNKMPHVSGRLWWHETDYYGNEAQARAALLIHILEKEKEHGK